MEDAVRERGKPLDDHTRIKQQRAVGFIFYFC
jgi:hypothetical protein